MKVAEANISGYPSTKTRIWSQSIWFRNQYEISHSKMARLPTTKINFLMYIEKSDVHVQKLTFPNYGWLSNTNRKTDRARRLYWILEGMLNIPSGWLIKPATLVNWSCSLVVICEFFSTHFKSFQGPDIALYSSAHENFSRKRAMNNWTRAIGYHSVPCYVNAHWVARKRKNMVKLFVN